MSVPPEALDLAKRWLQKALGDLRVAEATLKLPDKQCPFDAVCFHAQQCAEKSLKAYLTFRGIPFPKSHDLGRLLHLCAATPSLVRELSGVRRLTDYAMEVRYPGPEEPILRSEANQAVRLASRAYRAVSRKLRRPSK